MVFTNPDVGSVSPVCVFPTLPSKEVAPTLEIIEAGAYTDCSSTYSQRLGVGMLLFSLLPALIAMCAYALFSWRLYRLHFHIKKRHMKRRNSIAFVMSFWFQLGSLFYALNCIDRGGLRGTIPVGLALIFNELMIACLLSGLLSFLDFFLRAGREMTRANGLPNSAYLGAVAVLWIRAPVYVGLQIGLPDNFVTVDAIVTCFTLLVVIVMHLTTRWRYLEIRKQLAENVTSVARSPSSLGADDKQQSSSKASTNNDPIIRKFDMKWIRLNALLSTVDILILLAILLRLQFFTIDDVSWQVPLRIPLAWVVTQCGIYLVCIITIAVLFPDNIDSKNKAAVSSSARGEDTTTTPSSNNNKLAASPRAA